MSLVENNMTYTARKEHREYLKAAEWICIKALGSTNISKDIVKMFATALADAYNLGYDESVIQMTAMKRRQK